MAAGTSGSWEWDIIADVLWVDERFASLYNLDEAKARTPLPTSIFFSRMHPDDKNRMRPRPDHEPDPQSDKSGNKDRKGEDQDKGSNKPDRGATSGQKSGQR